jgi:hypothetical protein
MTTSTKNFVFWTPRILCILFALFISLFALDVFCKGDNFWQTLLSLFMHLIPTFVILIVLALSWRWEWVGGILFIAIGISYTVMAWGKFVLSVYFLISGPMFLIGILFLINWFYKDEIKTRKEIQ